MNAIMKKSNLRNYEVIPGPCVCIVKVSNSVKPGYLIEDGSKSRYIVNLRCGTTDGFEECLEVLGDREVIEFSSVSHCFMAGVIWENDLDDLTKLPAKGEEVIATFDYIDDILRCTAITLVPRKQLSTFDLDAHCKSRRLIKKYLK